jgi:hypothetical protein
VRLTAEIDPLTWLVVASVVAPGNHLTCATVTGTKASTGKQLAVDCGGVGPWPRYFRRRSWNEYERGNGDDDDDETQISDVEGRCGESHSQLVVGAPDETSRVANIIEA